MVETGGSVPGSIPQLVSSNHTIKLRGEEIDVAGRLSMLEDGLVNKVCVGNANQLLNAAPHIKIDQVSGDVGVPEPTRLEDVVGRRVWDGL